ncbi:PALP domain-containing protein [Mycena kentingensis (nom. inval.)]|nr:PALP domain-containing protein [Mycena kentingensis (nom. inval.)]
MNNPTPLVRSNALSTHANQVYLKFETVHPGMSFKSRGMTYYSQRAKEQRGPTVHLVIASGGNAGFAVACAARSLGVRCTVFLPEWPADSSVAFLKNENAHVVIQGKTYGEAWQAAKAFAAAEENAVSVPAYDDPIVWEGHSSLVKEIIQQHPEKPAAIFCSVGGAGLLGGVIRGCNAVGWDSVPIVALETMGTDCFYHSMALNRRKDVELPPGVTAEHDAQYDVRVARFSSFSSKASGSLGASAPAAGVVKMALERPGGVICVTMPDELAMQAACKLADDHKTLVELACSVTLVPAYKRELFEHVVQSRGDCVYVVCGGYKVSLDDLFGYRATLDTIADGKEFSVHCDGEVIQVKK